ncbi:MAG: LCP family protein [Oscillospiraceae bacterium]|nr:LCP family protein [Oscillospiraceae bacterium]
MGRYKGKFERGSGNRVRREEEQPARTQQPVQTPVYYEPQPIVTEEEPVMQPAAKKKMSTGLKIVLIFMLVIALLAIAVLGYTYHLLNKLDRTEYTGEPGLSYADMIGEADLQNMDADSAEIMHQADNAFESLKGLGMLETDSDIVNYLIIGTDRRDDSYMGNSDTMIIMSLNKKTDKIHLTSLMRAMYVSIPKDSGTVNGMLNWAYSMGGPELLVKTVEENFKVEIDHYAAIDFNSFQAIVDAVGGVEIELSYDEASWINKKTGIAACYEGTQILTGEQALWYSRCRSVGNDFVRTSRQRNVIESIIRGAGSLSLTQITELANTLLPAINTDMTNTEVLGEALHVLEYATYPIDQMMLPIENQDGEHYVGMITIGGHEMYSVDWNTNLPALQEFISE